MEAIEELKKKAWWDYLGIDLQKLFLTSQFLIGAAEEWRSGLPGGAHEFHDFSFVVFPAAKAYEGFLKKLFLELGYFNFHRKKVRNFAAPSIIALFAHTTVQALFVGWHHPGLPRAPLLARPLPAPSFLYRKKCRDPRDRYNPSYFLDRR